MQLTQIKEPKIKLKINVASILKKLEEKNGKRYAIREIVRQTGIARNTIRDLLRGEVKRINLDVLARLLTYIESEGLQVKAGDLFIVERVEPHHHKKGASG
jgi:transcriptional regulator with XRE-family HTH domain